MSNESYYQKIKNEAIRYYSAGSMSCSCCGESHLEFLTLVGGGRTGYPLFLWIRRNGYPAGIVVKCYNCSFVKGECPHAMQRRLKIEQIKKIG